MASTFLNHFLHDRTTRFSETQELVIAPILVPATDREREAFVGNGNHPAPILSDDWVRGDPMLGEFLHKIFRKPLSPNTRIDLLFLPFIRRELVRTEGDLGLHRSLGLKVPHY